VGKDFYPEYELHINQYGICDDDVKNSNPDQYELISSDFGSFGPFTPLLG
jgi:hypothetical protein